VSAASQPLVSVILIFFNAEAFLAEAIASVESQTCSDWELILVDDGSQDGGAGIAQAAARRQPGRVRLLEHPGRSNRGMSASRNLGLRAAGGRFVAFLDADDVYLPEKLERQAAVLEANPQAAMVYGPTQHWFSWSGLPEDQERDFYRPLGPDVDALVQPPTLVGRFLRHEAWTPGTCGALLRREAALAVGGFEDSFRTLMEDQVFFYKICLRFPVYVSSASYDRYRQHPASSCALAAPVGGTDFTRPNPYHRAFFTWLERELRRLKVRDPELQRALRQQAWHHHHPHLFAARMRLRKWVYGV
jgi:glycosyltransferase involved in cell wall biosynthesis